MTRATGRVRCGLPEIQGAWQRTANSVPGRKEVQVANEIPKNFNGYVLQDGRCVTIEDVDEVYQEIVSKVEDRGTIRYAGYCAAWSTSV